MVYIDPYRDYVHPPFKIESIFISLYKWCKEKCIDLKNTWKNF